LEWVDVDWSGEKVDDKFFQYEIRDAELVANVCCRIWTTVNAFQGFESDVGLN
jgi:hypothetical protein